MFPIVNKCICQKDVLCCSVDPAGYHHLHPWEVLWGLHSCSLLDQYDLHGNYQNDDEDVKKKWLRYTQSWSLLDALWTIMSNFFLQAQICHRDLTRCTFVTKYFSPGLLHSTNLPSLLASWQKGVHHYCPSAVVTFQCLGIISSTAIESQHASWEQSLWTIVTIKRDIVICCPCPSVMWSPEGKRAMRRRHRKTLGNYFIKQARKPRSYASPKLCRPT